MSLLLLKGKGVRVLACSASISTRLLSVLSVFAVFTLLDFESDLPGGCYLHEPVL